jgi:tripartite-type tricarboxylate transporter receptor subunit TctC
MLELPDKIRFTKRGENTMLKTFARAMLFALVVAGGNAGAAAYPERSITMIVAFAAGGATDISSRIVGKYLGQALNQQFVIDNRGGGGGMIAASAVMRAKPDGYTLLSSSSIFVVAPSLYKNPAYDPFKDFLPVVEFGASPNVMVVHPQGGINTVADLIAQAKANPNLISYGSPGLGTTPQLAAEVLKLRAKINMVHIAYTGGAPAVQAVLSKQIQMMSASLSSVMPQIAGGLLKPIVQTGKERWPDLPNVPTMAEAGIADAVSETFQALFAPAGTPPEVVSRLSKEAIAVLGQKEVRDALWTAGLKVTAAGPDVLRARVAQEVPMWRDIIDKAGIKAE